MLSGLAEVLEERRIRLVACAAAGRDRCIGKENKLPWKLPSDLKRFKQLTSGHHLITGRATYESIGRPLPDRTMVVVSRQSTYRAPGCLPVGSLEDAIRAVPEGELAFVIGGSTIYQQTLDFCRMIYYTQVQTRVAGGDTFFPKLDERWVLTRDESEDQRENDEFPFKFQEYCNRNYLNG